MRIQDMNDVLTPFSHQYVENKSLLTLLEPMLSDETWIWSEYYDYLMDTKRTQPFFMYFTSDTCDDMEEESEITSTRCNLSEWQANEQVLDTLITTSPSLRVVRVTIQQHPHAFHYHRILSYPSLLWFPPRSSPAFQRFAHSQTNWLNLSIPLNETKDTLDIFIQQCYKRSDLSTISAPSVVAHQSDVSILHLLVLGGIVLYVAQTLIPKLLGLFRNRLFWFLMAQTILYITLSGILYSIIHRVHLFYFHPAHGFIWIHPQGRHQFLLEGLMNGSWGFILSSAAFCMIEVMPRVSTRWTSHEVFRLALIVMMISYIIISILFTSKYRWVMS